MEFIHNLVKDKYLVFNVNGKKAPVNKTGGMMSGWGDMTYEDLCKEHNYNNEKWGINLGLQPNGKTIMSLDFDCFGCETTQERKKEYMELGEQAGLYTSSTDGNCNVLVDITDSKPIKTAIEKSGIKNKFNLEGMEVILGKNQIIPPTQTICKKTKQMGMGRQFQTPDAPFYIINGNYGAKVEKFIVDLFQEKMTQVKKTPKKIIAEKQVEQVVSLYALSIALSTVAVDPDDKYMELLFDVIGNEKGMIGMDDWMKIAGILKSNDYSLDILQKYTNKYSPKTEEIWRAFDVGERSIYGLENIAKVINPIGYKEWRIKHDKLITLATLERGEKDIADFIAPLLIDKLKYSCGVWWNYDCKTGLWIELEDPTYIFTDAIQREINDRYEEYKRQIDKCGINEKDKMDTLTKCAKTCMKYYQQCCKGSFTSQIKKFLGVILSCPDFMDSLDDGLYKMNYMNGVLDLKTMIFREGLRSDDFVSNPIQFEYKVPTEEQVATVNTVLKQICNWSDEHLDYITSALGYAMTGDSAKEQVFFNFVGQTASNGKSLLMESLMRIIPQYVGQSENTFLDKGADNGKVMCGWGGLKVLFCNELSKKKKDAELLKSIADGTSIKYKKLYAKKEQTMKLGFKLFTVSNNSLSVDADDGVARRLRSCEFNSQFKDEFTEIDTERLEFPRDKDLMNKLTGELKQAYLHIIYKAAEDYAIDKQLKPYPADWAEESKQVVEDNAGLKDWLDEHCEIGEGLAINKKALEQLFKNDLTGFNLKDELKKLKAGIKYDSQKTEYNGGGKRFKGFWTGFGLKKYNRFGEGEEEQAGN